MLLLMGPLIMVLALSAIWWGIKIKWMKEGPPRRFISPRITPKHEVKGSKTRTYHSLVWRSLMDPKYKLQAEGPWMGLDPQCLGLSHRVLLAALYCS